MPNDDVADSNGVDEGAGAHPELRDVLPVLPGAEGEADSAGEGLSPTLGDLSAPDGSQIQVRSTSPKTPEQDEWATPHDVFHFLNNKYGPFLFDLAADSSNAKCTGFFSKEDDALKQDWDQLQVLDLWCNPPYSRGMQGAFVKKARELAETSSKSVTLLVQAVMDTAWFHDHVLAGADLVEKLTIPHGPMAGVLLKFVATHCFIDVWLRRGRISFINPVTGAIAGTGTTGSMVLNFTPR
jgi:phage N-6-adenine-methyltransferase